MFYQNGFLVECIFPQLEMHFTSHHCIIPSPISANDWAQIGCFDQNNQPIKTKWVKLDAESKTVTVLLQVKPSYVILDPNLLLLDKNRDNNQLFLN